MKLVFAADPMCSWCYGFAKELEHALEVLPPMALEIRMAGLWADGQQVLDAAGKRFRLSHWARVEAAAGVPFNREGLMAREGFRYNSEPISRAFVAGQHLAPDCPPLRLLRPLQQAFYVDGLDTTDEQVLAEVLARALRAQGHAIAAGHTQATLRLPEVRQRVRQDFQQIRSWQLASFPKLLLRDEHEAQVLMDGFGNAEQIVAAVTECLPGGPGRA